MTTSSATDTTPRVWIGCLACYNAGSLVGDWFDAATADEVTTYDVHEAIARYFDWDSWTRDLAFDYTTYDNPEGGVFVFRIL